MFSVHSVVISESEATTREPELGRVDGTSNMNIAVKSLFRNRSFLIGFVIGLVLCAALNYFTYLNNWCNENIFDCYWHVGFPATFGVGQGGGYGFEHFIWLGVVTDILFLITASLLTGQIFMVVASRKTSPQD